MRGPSFYDACSRIAGDGASFVEFVLSPGELIGANPPHASEFIDNVNDIAGSLSRKRIVEVGGACGLVAERVCRRFAVASYTVIDGPSPCRLGRRYMECMALNIEPKFLESDDCFGPLPDSSDTWDFVCCLWPCIGDAEVDAWTRRVPSGMIAVAREFNLPSAKVTGFLRHVRIDNGSFWVWGTPPPLSDALKPVVAMYLGYTPPFHGRTLDQRRVFGSEIAAVRIAECLAKKGMDVHVFCSLDSDRVTVEWCGVHYHTPSRLQHFMDTHSVHTLVVSRYLHAFLEYEIKAKQVVFWMHDALPHPMWEGKSLPYLGKCLFKNLLPQMYRVVCVSEWQRDNALLWSGTGMIGGGMDKFQVIGNATVPQSDDVFSTNPRDPHKIVWCSDPSRGLAIAVQCFQEIRRQIPTATMDVFWSAETSTEQVEGLSFYDKLGQSELWARMRESAVWLYPTTSHETYCMAALEAQACGMVCVARTYSALATTISLDRGVLIDGDPMDDGIRNKYVKECVDLMTSPLRWQKYSSNACRWAATQTWSSRADEWAVMMLGRRS